MKIGMINVLIFLSCLLIFQTGFGKVITKDVEYYSGSTRLKGYLAYDDNFTTKRPGIIVVHEWWGLNEYPKKRARMLASLGYVAFAADMYGDGTTADNPGNAQKLASKSYKDYNLLKLKFLAALDFVKKCDFVDTEKIGAIGYCYGGGVVLNMARAGTDLKGVVSFHGSLSAAEPAVKGKVKAKILVCNGGADKFVSEKNITDFKNEMENAGVDLKFVSYKGALHAFTNPEATRLGRKFKMPIAYNRAGDRKSWEEMKRFFNKIFAK
jgi:dienelactone hydrolase